MSFLGVLAGIVAALTVLVLVATWRQRPATTVDASADHVRRFGELEADIAAGDIDPAQGAEIRTELERAVIDAVPETATVATRAGGGLVLGTVVVMVLGASIPLYRHLGSPELADYVIAHPGADLREPRSAVEVLLAQVRARTQAVPDDAEAWTVLARTNLSLGRYDEALAAAERLQDLAPADVSATLLLVDTLAMRDGGRFGPRARQLIAEVRARAPGNPTALVLDGITREQSGDREGAVTAWREALGLLPPGAPFRHELETMIAGIAPAAEVAAAEVTVTARIALAAALSGRAPADATVFVVARAVDGPPAPLAVRRFTLAELPLETTLDDTMAMLPGVSLKDFEAVYLVARVALAGTPRAQSGDLEGRSAPFAPGAVDSVELVIDHEVE